MGSHSVDQKTQDASSAAAQQSQQTLSKNAATAETNANNQTSTLFGTYNPQTNQYTGGTQSQYLNPSSMNTTGLTGSYASLYGQQADQQAQAAQRGVQTAQQNADSHGMGATPTGYSEDQQRQAYQAQATNNGQNFATDFGNQHNEQVSLFNNANTMLANSANQNQNSATANNTATAGNAASLYGTSSQQVQSPWAAAAGSVAQLGSAAAGFRPRG